MKILPPFSEFGRSSRRVLGFGRSIQISSVPIRSRHEVGVRICQGLQTKLGLHSWPDLLRQIS